MRSVFKLSSFFTRLPATIADKLRPDAARHSELSMKLAGADGAQVRLAAWKPVDSERLRWNDVLPYSHYKLPRLEVQSVALESGSAQRFADYFLPSSLTPAPTPRRMMITAVRERAL